MTTNSKQYTPTIHYRATPAIKSNPVLSWARDDKNFFAAGACHILAFLFIQLHPNEGFEFIHIKPKDGFGGNHVYASNGIWAFDYDGWTKETELLRVTEEAYSKEEPEWDYDRVVVTDNLEDFCKNNNHRSPSYFLHLPWKRAYDYINQFDSQYSAID